MRGRDGAQKWREHIDGLRAVAVLAVLLFHVGVPGFPGGFVGVDVFFVISGYLITGIIVAEIERTGRFDFARFYVRRIRRLFPALLFTLAASALAASLLLSPDDLGRFSGSMVAAILSVSNIYFWRESGYFDAAAELKPLLHTWSLSVEEQFYLVWPPALAVLAWAGWRRHAPLLVAALFAVGLVLAWSFQQDRAATFYLAPFRTYEFAIGAALVWIGRWRPDVTAGNAMVAVGLALIAYAIAAFSEATAFPGLAALVPCSGAALVILGGESPAGRVLLGNPLMVGVGLISYSLYLAHWPILVFVKYFSVVEIGGASRIGICLASIAVATLMYFLVERPFRLLHGAVTSRRAAPFLAGCAALAAIAIAPMLDAWRTNGWPWRVEKAYANAGSFAGNPFKWRETFKPVGESRGRIVLFGDSHARQYAGALSSLALEMGYEFQTIMHAACMSLPGVTNVNQDGAREQCGKLYEELLGLEPPSLLVIAYRWPKQLLVSGESDHLTGTPGRPEASPRFIEALLGGLGRLAKQLDARVPLLIIGNVPSALLPSGYPSCANRPIRIAACHTAFPRTSGEFYGGAAAFRDFAAASSGRITFLDPYDSLCDATTCYVVRDRVLYYSDHAHLTTEGAARVVGDHRHLIESAAK